MKATSLAEVQEEMERGGGKWRVGKRGMVVALGRRTPWSIPIVIRRRTSWSIACVWMEVAQ